VGGPLLDLQLDLVVAAQLVHEVDAAHPPRVVLDDERLRDAAAAIMPPALEPHTHDASGFQ